MSVRPPADDADVPRFWRELGLPGLVDCHVHFLPPRVQAKVWHYFEDAEAHYGAHWPIAYALPDDEKRLAVLERLGVRAFPTLPYAHKAGMAAWLNDWSAEFAGRDPRILQSATFYPQPEAPAYVAEALDRGARVFKVHVQVGDFDVRHPLLDEVWGQIAESGLPVVVHAGSGPVPNEHTGPGPVAEVLAPFAWLDFTDEMLARRVVVAVDRYVVLRFVSTIPGASPGGIGPVHPADVDDARVDVLVRTLGARQWRGFSLDRVCAYLVAALGAWQAARESASGRGRAAEGG